MGIEETITKAQQNFIDGCWEKFKTFYEEKTKNKKIIIYGAGIYAQFLYKALEKTGLNTDFYCFINDYLEQKSFLFEKPILKYIDIINPEDYIFIIGIQNNSAIVKKLKEDHREFVFSDYDLTFYENNLMYSVYKCIDSSPIADMFLKIEDYNKNYGVEFDETVLDYFDEELSRDILKKRLDFYKTGDCSLIDEMPKNYNQYYDDEYYQINDNEIIVDCGAFDGDSVLDFVRYVNGNYQKIYAIEPDGISIKKLRERTGSFHNIEVLECATGSHKGTLRFESKGVLGSRESDDGEEIRLETIDDLFEGKSVTLIKMDIEGAEFDTLKGASSIIKKCKPKLAICIYHKMDDIYTIPKYIRELVPEYKFRVRQHSNSMNETVLYAEI